MSLATVQRPCSERLRNRVSEVVRENGELLDLTMAELLQEAERSTPRLQMLTREQEAQLVSNEKLLLVAVCALNHWSLEEIVSAYCVSKAE
ncbi:hypothetical protein ACNT2N_21580 [Pseudomonas thivervalensis]|nr:hypothetical protein [Pseudomonas thivervalensis]